MGGCGRHDQWVVSLRRSRSRAGGMARCAPAPMAADVASGCQRELSAARRPRGSPKATAALAVVGSIGFGGGCTSAAAARMEPTASIFLLSVCGRPLSDNSADADRTQETLRPQIRRKRKHLEMCSTVQGTRRLVQL